MNREISDILDRWSISKLKWERIGSKESDKEYHAFKEALEETKKKYPEYNWDQFCEFIYAINSSIWFLEASLKGNKDILPNPHYLDDVSNREVLASIGKNTILIRNINALRVLFKNIINKLTKSGYMDKKKDHLSQGV